MRDQRRGLARIHGGQDAMDCLVAAGAEDGCAEDVLSLRVDENLDEAEGFAFLDRAADAGHGAFTDQCRLLRCAHFGFIHADVGERWVNVERARCNAIAHAAGRSVEQIVGDDFVVVVRSMGESAATVAIANSENAGDGGA